ncbi:MAG: HAD-IIA family hydrolase [Conexivisphaerales archaeon]|jgi:4-nitrophenyl phosphatase
MTKTAFAGVMGVLIDLDGCMCVGDAAVPSAAESVSALREKGTEILFVTNNATKTPAQCAEKLVRMGVAAQEQDIFISAMATADYLFGKYGPRHSVYVLGGDALKGELSEAGWVILSEDDAKTAEFVVSCLDLELTYGRLRAACWAIQGGTRYIVTNLDASLPVQGGYEPGSGAIAAALTTATSTEPALVGKPSPIIVEMALKHLGVERDRVVMVGDRPNTDVRAAKAAGLRSILVLTGSTRKEEVEKAPRELAPDAIVNSIADLPSLLA